jgi:acetyl-CoA carboxylase biotin carboxylase subunit
LVTVVDLVAEQLQIASGQPLGVTGDQVTMDGAAIEFRINAEDPERGFLPSPGRFALLRLPAGPGVRVDTCFETGRSVPPFYDSLVAKVMVWGVDREQALVRARRTLSELAIDGIASTKELHQKILAWNAFCEGVYHTNSLEDFLKTS